MNVFMPSIYFSVCVLTFVNAGTSLVTQRLGLGTFTAVGPGSIPGQETKIPQAAWCSQNRTKFVNVFKGSKIKMLQKGID